MAGLVSQLARMEHILEDSLKEVDALLDRLELGSPDWISLRDIEVKLSSMQAILGGEA